MSGNMQSDVPLQTRDPPETYGMQHLFTLNRAPEAPKAIRRAKVSLGAFVHKQHDQAQSKLLSLPVEIQHMILELALQEPWPIQLAINARSAPGLEYRLREGSNEARALLATCQRMH